MAPKASRQLARLAADLRDAPKTWRLESGRLLRDTARDVAVPALREAALARLPKRGRLDAWVAEEKISTLTSFSGSPYVRVKQPYLGAWQTNRGYVRHPVFADGSKSRREWTWVTQPVPLAAGWWSDTWKRIGPRVTDRLVQALREMSDAIEARI